MKPTCSTRLIQFLEQQPGWRLWLGFSLGSLLASEVIVSLMGLLLKGAVTFDYLLTGLVAAGVVAPVAVAGLTRLLQESRQGRADAVELQRLRAHKNMQVGLDAAHMLFWELNLVSGSLSFDDSRLHWLGLVSSPSLHTLTGWIERVHPDDRALLLQSIDQGGLDQTDACLEYRFAAAPEQWFWYRTVARMMPTQAGGALLLAAGCTINITAQKEAELALAASTQLLQTIIDTVPLRVFWKDRQLRYLGCNPAFAHDAGLADPKDVLGKSDHELSWKDEAAQYAADDLAVIDGGVPKQSYVEQQTGPNGQRRWLRTSKVPLIGQNQGTIGVLGVYEDVTAFKQAEQALRASEQRANRLATMLRLVSDNVPDMIWAKDLDRRFLFANKAMCDRMLGASSADEPIGRDDLFFAQRERQSHPDNPLWHTFGEACQASDDEVLRLGHPLQIEESGYVRGRLVVLDAHKAPLLDDHGRVIGVVGSARDVTAHKTTQDKLRLAAMVLDHSSEALLVTDAHNQIVDVNPAFTTLTGYTRAEVIGKTPSLLSSGRQSTDFFKSMWQALNSKGRWQGELWNKRKNGEIFAEWLTINTIYHPDGSVHRRVALFSDVTEKKQAEELIWKQANFDALTGLPNRRMFLDRLGQDLLKAQRSGHRLALLYLDLDHFKEVNDTLGHESGDALLAEAARRISACVRATDTVARLGGDEFTVILPQLDGPDRVEVIARNIIAALSRHYQLQGRALRTTVSIGITFYPEDATQIDRLLENADQAMYEAKRAGRNRLSFFTPAIQQRAQGHADLMSDLRLAMTNGQLALFFQPIVDVPSGEVHKVEALLRWFHPQRGLISPAEFIPLAEDCGLIHPLGAWVFEQALAQAGRWSRLIQRPIKMALNLSPLQLLQAQAHRLAWREQLASGGLGGENFVMEISQDLLRDDAAPVQTQLQAFQSAGTGLAVNQANADLGTLMALKKRPVDYFKMDKDIVHNLAPDSDALALAHALVVMAHHLNLQVIAEGVETPEQHRLLGQIGCDLAQGFFYARPMPASEIEALLAQGGRLGPVDGKSVPDSPAAVIGT